MKVTLLAIGRLKRGAESELCDRYISRIDRQGSGVAIGPVEVIEIIEARGTSVSARKSDEAEALLSRIPDGAPLIALDEAGRSLTSMDFSGWLSEIRDDGVASVAFAIGGPDGHGEALLHKAQFRLALGAMTYPHGLARALLLEQIYRAITILSGHPYHRER